MKKISLLLAGLVLSATGTFAQIKEGSATYSLDLSSDDPNMQAAIGMMAGSTITTYFKDGASRLEVAMGMMNMTTVSDGTSGQVLILTEIPSFNMKYAMKTSATELESSEKTAEDLPDFDIRYENETKEILGYTCKKAVITDEDGVESTFWYTEDIFIIKTGQAYLNEKVPGFPLEYDMYRNGMKISAKATAVDTKIDKKKVKELFSTEIPAGYVEKTLEDFKRMGQGM